MLLTRRMSITLRSPASVGHRLFVVANYMVSAANLASIPYNFVPQLAPHLTSTRGSRDICAVSEVCSALLKRHDNHTRLLRDYAVPAKAQDARVLIEQTAGPRYLHIQIS